MEGANWSDKVQMGDFTFDNRIVMASLTRERCDPKDSIPTDMLVEYYTQRVGGAFIPVSYTHLTLPTIYSV